MLGDRGDQLLLNTLTRNKDRAVYLQNALHSIFEATSNRESLKPELLHVSCCVNVNVKMSAVKPRKSCPLLFCFLNG